MLTQKADLFASEMIHLNLHERPYFWIETSLQNLVQPPDAGAWCHIVSLFTQLPAYCSASIGRRYMCGARDHLYRAGPTQGRIHPVSSTLQLQDVLWSYSSNWKYSFIYWKYHLALQPHIKMFYTVAMLSLQKSVPEAKGSSCEGEHHDPSEKASLISCLRNCTKQPWCHCFEPPTPECTLSCGTPPSPSPSTPAPTATSSLSCTSTSFIIAVVHLSWGQSPQVQCFKCIEFTISNSRTALLCPGRCAVISAQEQSPFLMSVKKAAAACPPPFLIVFSCEMGPREEELWTRITPRKNTQIHKYPNTQTHKYNDKLEQWT